jgi:hypothetical protein
MKEDIKLVKTEVKEMKENQQKMDLKIEEIKQKMDSKLQEILDLMKEGN